MTLQEIFDQLTYGELAQVSLGGGEGDNLGITATNYPMIIAHINLGLTELHKRFVLRKETMLVRQDATITNYVMHKKYATSNTSSTETNKYIIDNAGDPFQSNILKIEQVQIQKDIATMLGVDKKWTDISVNDITDPESVFINKMNTITVNEPTTGTEMRVVYRASLPKLDANMIDDPEYVELDFDYTHLGALLLFVASRVHSNLPALNGVNEGNNYMMKYEAECKRLENLDLEYKANTTDLQLDNNGWV